MEIISACKNCRKQKAPYVCGLCMDHICKSCAKFMDEDAFSFRRKIPAELKHITYCPQCFDESVAAPLSDYEELMEKAKEVVYFTKAQTKQTGHIKRKEEPLRVEDCEDEQETILRLAFQAAEGGFNTILDLDISHRKIIVGSHKKTVYSGTAIPVNVEPKKVREY